METTLVIEEKLKGLWITDEEERKQVISDIARGLRANVIQLKNGDYIIVTD